MTDPRRRHVHQLLGAAVLSSVFGTMITWMGSVLASQASEWATPSTVEASVVLTVLAQLTVIAYYYSIATTLALAAAAALTQRAIRRHPFDDESFQPSVLQIRNALNKIEALSREAGDLSAQRKEIEQQVQEAKLLLTITEPQREALMSSVAPGARKMWILTIVTFVIGTALSVLGLLATDGFPWP